MWFRMASWRPATPVIEKLRVARRGDFVLRGHRCRLYKKVTSIVEFRKVKGDDDICTIQ